jgi:hypothetical protein
MWEGWERRSFRAHEGNRGDVHQATISVAVMESGGKQIMECLPKTKPATILEFIHGVRGTH